MLNTTFDDISDILVVVVGTTGSSRSRSCVVVKLNIYNVFRFSKYSGKILSESN